MNCSQTHKLGCGPYYKRDVRRAAAAAAALKRARPQIEATIAADRRKIAVWQAPRQPDRKPSRHDQGRPRLPRPPGGAGAGREGEPGCQEVRRVLPCLPDRHRPRRAHPQAHPSLQHRRRLRAKRGGSSNERPRRDAPSRGARRRPDPPHHARGAGRGGCGRAQDPGRALTRARLASEELGQVERTGCRPGSAGRPPPGRSPTDDTVTGRPSAGWLPSSARPALRSESPRFLPAPQASVPARWPRRLGPVGR